MDQQTANHWPDGELSSQDTMNGHVRDPALLFADYSIMEDDMLSAVHPSYRYLPNIEVQSEYPLTFAEPNLDIELQDFGMSAMPALESQQDNTPRPFEHSSQVSLDYEKSTRPNYSSFQPESGAGFYNEDLTSPTVPQTFNQEHPQEGPIVLAHSENTLPSSHLSFPCLPEFTRQGCNVSQDKNFTSPAEIQKTSKLIAYRRRKEKAFYRRSISRVASTSVALSYPKKTRRPDHSTSNSSDTTDNQSSRQGDIDQEFEAFNPNSTLAQRKKAYLLQQKKKLADQQADLVRQMKELMVDDERFGGHSDVESNDNITSTVASSQMSSATSENAEANESADGTSISSTPRLPDFSTQTLVSQRKHEPCADCGYKTLYLCTFPDCGHGTHSLADYKRHEAGEAHWPQNRFMCLECTPGFNNSVYTIPTNDLGHQICDFCKVSCLSNPVPFEQHYLQCADARNSGTYFGRLDHLIEHLRKIHDIQGSNKAEQKEINQRAASWRFPINSKWPRQCGFCGYFSESWEERMKHLTEHFQAGLTKKNWKLPFHPPKDFRPGSGFKKDDDDEGDNKTHGRNGNSHINPNSQQGQRSKSGAQAGSSQNSSGASQGRKSRGHQRSHTSTALDNTKLSEDLHYQENILLLYSVHGGKYSSVSHDSGQHPLILQRYLNDPFEPVAARLNLAHDESRSQVMDVMTGEQSLIQWIERREPQGQTATKWHTALLEPLSALSIARNILQSVDLGIKLVSADCKLSVADQFRGLLDHHLEGFTSESLPSNTGRRDQTSWTFVIHENDSYLAAVKRLRRVHRAMVYDWKHTVPQSLGSSESDITEIEEDPSGICPTSATAVLRSTQMGTNYSPKFACFHTRCRMKFHSKDFQGWLNHTRSCKMSSMDSDAIRSGLAHLHEPIMKIDMILFWVSELVQNTTLLNNRAMRLNPNYYLSSSPLVVSSTLTEKQHQHKRYPSFVINENSAASSFSQDMISVSAETRPARELLSVRRKQAILLENVWWQLPKNILELKEHKEMTKFDSYISLEKIAVELESLGTVVQGLHNHRNCHLEWHADPNPTNILGHGKWSPVEVRGINGFRLSEGDVSKSKSWAEACNTAAVPMSPLPKQWQNILPRRYVYDSGYEDGGRVSWMPSQAVVPEQAFANSVLDLNEEDLCQDLQACTFSDCGRVFKGLKAHILTHQHERPEKCPIYTCEYCPKGFATKSTKTLHAFESNYESMACNFCPTSRSSCAAEKSVNRAGIFKTRLRAVHGVEQTPRNSGKEMVRVEAAQSFPGETALQDYDDAFGSCNLGLYARKTTACLHGDIVFALMGLLRHRPMIDEIDSEFQAGARLSLANDSVVLLQRLERRHMMDQEALDRSNRRTDSSGLGSCPVTGCRLTTFRSGIILDHQILKHHDNRSLQFTSSRRIYHRKRSRSLRAMSYGFRSRPGTKRMFPHADSLLGRDIIDSKISIDALHGDGAIDPRVSRVEASYADKDHEQKYIDLEQHAIIYSDNEPTRSRVQDLNTRIHCEPPSTKMAPEGSIPTIMVASSSAARDTYESLNLLLSNQASDYQYHTAANISRQILHARLRNSLQIFISSNAKNSMGSRPVGIRPRISKDEVDILERAFRKNPKPTTQIKRGFAEDMGVNLARINNWFQNRRAKRKQEKKQESYEAAKSQTMLGLEEPSPETRSEPDFYESENIMALPSQALELVRIIDGKVADVLEGIETRAPRFDPMLHTRLCATTGGQSLRSILNDIYRPEDRLSQLRERAV